jgi:hypothetical protein
MLLALALLFFAAHVVAWMVLPASKVRSEHTAHAPEFSMRSQSAVAEA